MHWGALIVACGLLATMVTGEPDRAKYQIHMDRAKAAMATADYGMALSEYTLAADADPTNYMALYMRAMVQQATGRTKATLVDLARVLEMRPDFHQARVQRMEVHIKAYNLKEARVDLAELLRTFPTNEEYHEAERKMMSAETNLKAGKDADARGDYHNADRFYSFVIDVAPNYEEVRMLRGRVKLHKGEPESAVGDVARAAKLRSDNTQAYLLLTDIYYDLGELDEALKSIRECLKLDQSHPQCKPVYTKLKKLSKALNKAEEKRTGGDHHGAVERLKDALKAEREHPHYLVRTHKLICNSLLKLRRAQDAIAACNEALKHEPEDSEALCDTGEAHLLLELFQEALNFFQRAKQSDSGSHHIQQLLERTQRLIKQASRRDYYKILGLSRGCTKREVTKAYRSLALQWHPDKFDGEAEKKEAEKRFMDIAAAKEVLSDDDLRAIFDNGEDPLDAEEVQKRQQQQQHQHHFNPFGGGGGGGGQRFHFNFGG